MIKMFLTSKSFNNNTKYNIHNYNSYQDKEG